MPKPGPEKVGEGLHVQGAELEVTQASSLMQSFERAFPRTMPAIGLEIGPVSDMLVLSRVVPRPGQKWISCGRLTDEP
jgi:hypothetical protein